MASSPPPTKIMIIRHAEKPPKPPNNAGPWDVLVTGQTGDGNSDPAQENRCRAPGILIALNEVCGVRRLA
jgi:hypothetical protein